MIRQHTTFDCEGSRLLGTIDVGHRPVGLVIVSGGNETRAGAFDGQAQLARRLAEQGYPVFRFDRRGVGDSEGENNGFRGSAADIAAAIHHFRVTLPGLERIVAFGNCDAASALMLCSGKGANTLVLSNPWSFDEGAENSPPPPSAVRSRYLGKLANPKEWWRLLTGQVDMAKLTRGLGQAASVKRPFSALLAEMRQGLERFAGDVHFLIAGADRTGQTFAAAWGAGDPRMNSCEGASHAYAEAHARDWLYQQLLAILAQEEAR